MCAEQTLSRCDTFISPTRFLKTGWSIAVADLDGVRPFVGSL